MIFTPLTIKKINRFRKLRRGYYSFIILAVMILIAVMAEVVVHKRAIIVHYNNQYYFPSYGDMLPGTVFGLDYNYETNYRQLKQQCQGSDWVLMPLIPFGPYENDFMDNQYPPFPPSARHYLGTDKMGRDVLARLVYGFRIAIFFSLGLLLVNYTIGVSIGCAMGYWGGKFDLFFQRVIEIWSNIPFLYIIIIISSLVVPNFFILIIIMAFFGWMGITWTMRTITYKEKTREYILAARVMGASDLRIIFKHIIPNTIAIIVTYAPFSVSSGIVALTSLDYLGFGLPPPTPSWGELLQQGWANMDAWWIGSSVICTLVLTLTTVTFIGEAVRESFDPKMHTTYE